MKNRTKVINLLIVLLAIFTVASCQKIKEIANNLTNKVDKKEKIAENSTAENPSYSENGELIQNAPMPTEDSFDSSIAQAEELKRAPINEEYTKANSQAFFSAIINENIPTIKKMVAQGFDINAIAPNSESAISQAILAGSYEALQLLVALDANINIASETGFSPLSLAIYNRDDKALDILLASKKADLYFVAEDMWNASPLYVATYEANTYMLERLIKAGANLSHSFANFQAPPLLSYAILSRNHQKIADHRNLLAFLILNKVDINAQNNMGQTPLMIAIRERNVDAFNSIIVSNPNTDLRDNDNHTALDYAKNIYSLLPNTEPKNDIEAMIKRLTPIKAENEEEN